MLKEPMEIKKSVFYIKNTYLMFLNISFANIYRI